MLQGNCYLVKCGPGGQGVIIDPGDEAGRIEAEARRMGLEPEAILLTHGHIDHVNAAGPLRKRFRCRVACHARDREMVESGEVLSLFGMQREPCPVDQEVAEGNVINVGSAEIRVIHCPGHTRGSVCYMVDSALYSGDVIFMGSIGRTDLPGGSDREMMDTLKNKIAVLDPGLAVFPGHGPETTIGRELEHNPFLRM
jgi:glyoxylase-like metal-dependent hydrolase (beta-lactamase superfamily II)